MQAHYPAPAVEEILAKILDAKVFTKTETLDEIMDLTTFDSRSNVRQIGSYICPGCKDVKCVTNMLSYGMVYVNIWQRLVQEIV